MKNAPAYVKVYSRLKNEINKGTYPVGGFLPKECELEKIYQVSRTTVRNAVKMLVQEGLVEVRQGSGTRVLNHKAIQNYNKVTSVTESLMKKGYRVTTSDMMIDIISADKQLADELEIPEGTSVARIQRLQLADEEPVTLMENYIEYAKVPGIEAYENQFVALYQFLIFPIIKSTSPGHRLRGNPPGSRHIFSGIPGRSRTGCGSRRTGRRPAG